MQRAKSLILAIIFFTISPCLCWSWQGKVVGVSDGDTITVMHEGKGERIRVYGVDTPEKRQDFGSRAKEFTSSFAFGKSADVEPVETDKYGRTVGIVSVNGKVLNRTLVEEGMAWVYDQYCRRGECSEWRQLQEKAKASKVGLWSQSNPTPPWEFRHPNGKKTESAREAGQVRESQLFSGYPSGKETAAKGTAYQGNIKSHVFHRPGCSGYNCENCTATFASRGEAVKAGYRPCGICRP